MTLTTANPREEREQSQVRVIDLRPKQTGDRRRTPVEIEGATRTRDEEVAAAVVDAAVIAQVEAIEAAAPTVTAREN